MLAAAAIPVVSFAGATVWTFNSGSNTTSTMAAEEQWLIKLADLAVQFPPGSKPSLTGPTEVTEQSASEQYDPMRGATLIPADCANPAENNGTTKAPAGATVDSLTGTIQNRMLQVSALVSPQPIPVPGMPPHCHAVVFYKPGLVQGFTRPVALPTIPDGVTVKSSQAVRISSTVTDNTGQNTETIRYIYSALLDDLHTVTVAYTGEINPTTAPDIDPAPAHRLFTPALATLAS